MRFIKNGGEIAFDFEKGCIDAICYAGTEISAKSADIFSVRLTDRNGVTVDYSSREAKSGRVVETDQVCVE